ncbi:hypothetical protein B0H14DRAFT_2572640 [Mycena olivaceomarginata]|nr:hypothetical protein B0H14DRAFT_2572640 [Mycena olivaceomarginata]
MSCGTRRRRAPSYRAEWGAAYEHGPIQHDGVCQSPLVGEETLWTFFVPFGEIHYVKVAGGEALVYEFEWFVDGGEGSRYLEYVFADLRGLAISQLGKLIQVLVVDSRWRVVTPKSGDRFRVLGSVVLEGKPRVVVLVVLHLASGTHSCAASRCSCCGAALVAGGGDGGSQVDGKNRLNFV